MRQYISEEEAYYQDLYHGQFSRKLAKWAIDKMEAKDPTSGKMEKITARSVEDMEEILRTNNINVPDRCIYTAWYLFNMAVADYPKTCKTDSLRATFVEETLLDPDGDPSNVLECFVAKMRNAGIPVYWERFI